MKTIIDRASTRGHFDHGWLRTYHTFSFADYFNPERMGFGTLRILNDDTIKPGRGFATHTHRNMEVISIPLKGFLRHGDSLENSDVITVGSIQLMSAGTGIFHSEFNDSQEKDLQFLQIWIIPRETNIRPKYENYDIRPLIKPNELSTFVSPNSMASVQQDAWLSMGNLDKGITAEYNIHTRGNGVYVFVIEGEVKVGNTKLERRDGMGIWETGGFTVQALEKSQILLIEVPM